MSEAPDRTDDSLPKRLIIGGNPLGHIEIYNDDREFIGRGRIASAPPPGGTAFVRADDADRHKRERDGLLEAAKALLAKHIEVCEQEFCTGPHNKGWSEDEEPIRSTLAAIAATKGPLAGSEEAEHLRDLAANERDAGNDEAARNLEDRADEKASAEARPTLLQAARDVEAVLNAEGWADASQPSRVKWQAWRNLAAVLAECEKDAS